MEAEEGGVGVEASERACVPVRACVCPCVCMRACVCGGGKRGRVESTPVRGMMGHIFCCSALTAACALGLASSIAPSHVAVMLEVCWPAKRSTISQPVTSESVKPRPALVTWGRECQGLGLELGLGAGGWSWGWGFGHLAGLCVDLVAVAEVNYLLQKIVRRHL